MENASKALIIAGAILISILIISVGILVMNSTNDVTEGVSQEGQTMAIQTFNSKFLAYETDTNSSAQIKSLISAENGSNGAYKATSEADEMYIAVEWSGGLTAAKLDSRKRYTVTLGYDTTGYINKVTISETP